MKANVSNEFEKFYSKKQGAYDKAKKAESSLQSCPMPIDTEGQAVVLSATAGMSRKNNPVIKMEFGVQTPDQFKGKKFRKSWTLNSTAKATDADRFEWMLNDFELMGLPREVRENHESISELLGWFLEDTRNVNFTVVADSYASDGKAVRCSADNDLPVADLPFSTTETEEEKVVKYNGVSYYIVESNEDETVLKSVTKGREITVPTEELDL